MSRYRLSACAFLAFAALSAPAFAQERATDPFIQSLRDVLDRAEERARPAERPERSAAAPRTPAPVTRIEPGRVSVTVTEGYSLPNDRAEVSFDMVTEGADPAEVMARNNEKMAAILAAVADAGVAEGDLVTSGIDLQPIFEHDANGNASTISAYRMRNRIGAEITQLDRVGEVIAAAIGAGANGVSSFRMDAAPRPDRERQLRVRAIRKAEREAQMLSGAAGARIVGIESIDVRGGSPGPVPVMRMAEMASADSVPVASGETDREVTVTVTYRIVLDPRARDREAREKDERRSDKGVNDGRRTDARN